MPFSMTTKLTQLNIFLFEDGGNIKKGVIKCEVFNGLLQDVFRKTIKTHVHTSIPCVLLHLLSGLHNIVCQLYDVVKKYCLLRTKQVSSYTKLGLKNKHHVLLQLSLGGVCVWLQSISRCTLCDHTQTISCFSQWWNILWPWPSIYYIFLIMMTDCTR